jgi:EAL domain-containing protein (putative c-di-GMP-specific phosphodiesterase class I)
MTARAGVLYLVIGVAILGAFALYELSAGDRVGALVGGVAALAFVLAVAERRALVERLRRRPADHPLVAELKRAIDEEQLVLHYQPVVTLPGGRVTGVEALVRWQHPRRGMVQPADFIPLAEQSGPILAIDEWVLWEACRRARPWGDLTVHVNVSARQVLHGDLTSLVSGVLVDTGLEPERLTIEITEGTLMEDTESTLDALRRLRHLGVRLAIDDFGIGFSSLSYLRRLPVDVVKIDREFVSGIAAGADEWSLARGIVRLLHSLGRETVAEGIERPEQVAHLVALGCQLGQGFYFARPVPPEAIDAVLETGVLGERTGTGRR